jgi:aspartyl protease family protein
MQELEPMSNRQFRYMIERDGDNWNDYQRRNGIPPNPNFGTDKDPYADIATNRRVASPPPGWQPRTGSTAAGAPTTPPPTGYSAPATGVASGTPVAPTLIPLRWRGGVFTVPVSINNKMTLNFLLDSGAADVTLPADVVMTLMRMGTLNAADFLEKKEYVLADGSVVPSQTFRIKSLQIGDKIVENVIGSIGSVKGDPLLGQSFLSRFKSWSIDNRRGALILE